MAREISAESLVALPKLGIDSGLALWQALRTVVMAEKRMPKVLQAAWQRVESAGEVLYQEAQARLGDGSQAAPLTDRRLFDNAVDNVVAALDDYLAAWMRLSPARPRVQLATKIRQALFPDGTAFIKLPYNQQWAQVERRMALMKSAGLDKQLAELGAEDFVLQLEEAHLAYGKALGLTAVPATPTPAVDLREPLAALAAALRLYVIKVTAYGDDEDPATAALAERLLRPLLEWTSRAAKPSGDGEPEPDPTPTGG